MLNLLLEASSSNWFTKYGMLIVIAVILVLFMVFTYSRRKKEDGYYQELNSQIKPGASVKTRSGIYGKVISITETTDGKIVLLETGEGNRVSYQNIHIDAIFAIDNKQPVFYDADGGRILPEEPKNEEMVISVVEPVAKTETKPTTAKSTTQTKKTTQNKNSNAKASSASAKPTQTNTAKASSASVQPTQTNTAKASSASAQPTQTNTTKASTTTAQPTQTKNAESKNAKTTSTSTKKTTTK